jgi:hypothetical protein
MAPGKVRPIAIALVLGASASCAFGADTIYKSVRRDGSVVYGDEPVKGAARVTKLDIPRAADNRSASAGAGAPPAESAAVEAANDRARDRLLALDRVDMEIKSAARAVERAQEQLELAAEPQGGERTGNAGGGSRLTDVYFTRIGALQAQLEAAKQRLDDAYAKRNELRD